MVSPGQLLRLRLQPLLQLLDANPEFYTALEDVEELAGWLEQHGSRVRRLLVPLLASSGHSIVVATIVVATIVVALNRVERLHRLSSPWAAAVQSLRWHCSCS